MSLLSIVGVLLLVSSSVLAGYGGSSGRSLLDTSNAGIGGYFSSINLPSRDIISTSSNTYGSSSSSPIVLDQQTAGYRGSSSRPIVFDTLLGGYGNIRPNVLDVLPTNSYGSSSSSSIVFDTPRFSGYSGLPVPANVNNMGEQQFDLPTSAPGSVANTQWDMMCIGKAPSTKIALSDMHSWVVCVDNGKGEFQQCPGQLWYDVATDKCEHSLNPIHPCSESPCFNGGQCISTGASSFDCRCPMGFDGEKCELDARVCHSQNPCGGETCQSFNFNAALAYVCIIGENQAYGPSRAQATINPCGGGRDGPQGLSYTLNGFLICVGNKFHVYACPGGTIWNDGMKACSWPNMATPQFDIGSNYGTGGYSSSSINIIAPPTQQLDIISPIISSSYGGGMQRDVISKPYGAPKTLDVIRGNRY